jgi:predicted RNA-binding Zn-ribbon protein involved in translation (DUF1610 family)
MNVASLARTLDQELVALARGVSLECPVCGEFVFHAVSVIACPECRLILADGSGIPTIELPSVAQAG